MKNKIHRTKKKKIEETSNNLTEPKTTLATSRNRADTMKNRDM